MIRDEDLVIYLDGEGDPARNRAIEAALTTDPRLRARLDELQRADRDVKAAFNALLATPTPDRLVQSVRAGGPAPNAAPMAEVLPFTPPARKAVRWTWPASIAAALAVGVLVGQLAPAWTPAGRSDWLTDGPGAPRAGAAIAAGLSGSPSGVAFNLPGGRKATPRLTFASQAGQLCRQFDIAGADGRQTALACRSSRDAWRLVGLTSAEPAAQGGAYETAAGPGGDPVSALADRMIKGEPLDAAQEAAALRTGAARSGTPAR